MSDLASAAHEYSELGWRVFPVEGKIPVIKKWTVNATCDEQQIDSWWNDNSRQNGIGIATGEDSGIWVLDIDVGDGKNGAETLAELQNQHGQLPRTVTSKTGSGGLHLYFIYDQDSPVTNGLARHLGPGIDVRGEGGFVVAPPSPHPTGSTYRWVDGRGPWDLNVAPAPQWLYALLFPATTDVIAPPAPARPDTGDSIAAWINDNNAWEDLLSNDGWAAVRYDTSGDVYWLRPGKTETQQHSHSAIEHPNGVLSVFSTDHGIKHLWTERTNRDDCAVLTKFDYIAITRYNDDRSECARVERKNADQKASASVEQLMDGISRITSTETNAKAVPTAPRFRTDIAIPEKFWSSRPALKHIQQAAENRGRSADAVLGAVLARVAALADFSIVLPAVVGTEGSLNCAHALVGPSGSGKSNSIQIAASLVAAGESDGTRLDTQLGAGEGITESYYGLKTKQVDGKTERNREQVIYQQLFVVNEVDQMSAQAERQGSTLMSTIRQAISGEPIGQNNATADRSRKLPAHAFRFAMIIGVQPSKSVGLLNDVDGGTPQRFVWFSLKGPTIKPPRERPEWPGPLSWTPPQTHEFPEQMVGARNLHILEIPDDIKAGIADVDYENVRPDSDNDAESSHRGLGRLKLAALLALLDERSSINHEDWDLSAMVIDTSSELYEAMEDLHAQLNKHTRQASESKDIQRQARKEEDRASRALDSAKASILAKAKKLSSQQISRRQAQQCLSALGREAPFSLVMDTLEEEGQLVRNSKKTWQAT